MDNYSSASSSVLLISPKTYNYHNILRHSLEGSGINCLWIDERPYSHFLFKTLSRGFNWLARRISIDFYISRVRSLASAGFSPSHVLVIKGEAIHASVLAYIRSIFPQAKLVLYFWDSCQNLPGHHTILPFFDVIASFDSRDCSINNWLYYPLFSGNAAEALAGGSKSRSMFPRTYDWSFVGVVHSDRLKVIDRLIRSSPPSCRFFVYIYFPSLAHIFWFLASSPSSFLRLLPYTKTSPLSPERLSLIYDQSLCIVDVHHPSQSGLTIRTIESLLSGIKLATTNSCVSKEPLFSPDRVLILDRSSPHISPVFLDLSFSDIPDSIASPYKPARWVTALLNL